MSEAAGAEPVEFVADGFTFRVDPVTLRDSCTDPAGLAEFCDAHPTLPATVAYLRMLGRLDEAEQRGRATLPDSSDPARRAAALARLAHVQQWQGRFDEALATFEAALADVEHLDHPRLHASVLQHRAKCRLDAGDLCGALADARAALNLRRDADEDEIASTRLLISVCDARARTGGERSDRR